MDRLRDVRQLHIHVRDDTFKGQFNTTTAMTGTLRLADQFTYNGTAYSCATTVTISATRQG